MNQNLVCLSSKLSWLSAKQKTRSLEFAQFARVVKICGKSIERPPSSYNHQTSIVPQFWIILNRLRLTITSVGNSFPFGSRKTMRDFLVCFLLIVHFVVAVVGMHENLLFNKSFTPSSCPDEDSFDEVSNAPISPSNKDSNKLLHAYIWLI